MNAVEIEEAVSKLVEEPFNAAEFSYAFLEAFSNKTATIQRLHSVGKNSTKKTDFVLSKIFRAMDLPRKTRETAKLRPRSCKSPYVNGGLFGSSDSAFERGTVPKFTQNARSYLLHIGLLDWTRLNPDIFGSMIQTVADDEERGTLGMHHTSVPNILKVLDPLFLDDLHVQLKEAGKNPRKLLNLRKRLAPNRVFDPACGSGNFSVIAYKVIRKIEAEINILREESDRAPEIPLTNFRGIELRHFAVEIDCLALIIAEYQCDGLYRGQCRCEFSCQSILDHWSMACLESQPISNSLKRSIG